MSDLLIKILLAFLLATSISPVQAFSFSAKAKFVGMTKVVRAGQQCSVTVQCQPNSFCQITVQKPNGKASRSAELTEKRSDAAGIVNWTWQMVEDAQPGDRLIVVKCIGQDNDETTIMKKMKVL